MFDDEKSDTSGEVESDVPDDTDITANDKEVEQKTTESPQCRKASTIFYAVGTLIAIPRSDPSDEHVRWLQETFQSHEVEAESDQFDVFQAVLDQYDIPNVCASELGEFMVDFIMKQRDIIEPMIVNNLKAHAMTFEKYVDWMVKGTTNGFDITLKCISMML